MEEGNYNIIKIKVSNLLLNPENYRFTPQSNQREAIDVMLRDQGEKLYRLAEDIVTNGLNPSEGLMVTPIEDVKTTKKLYKVLEGNRRITALKLLAIPESIEGEEFSKLKSKFQKLHKLYAQNPISSVTCVVFEKESDANIWIEKKHALGQNGAGTEMWDSKMKQRFDEATKGKKSIVLQTLDLLRNSEEASVSDILLLDNVKSTNLERLLSDSYVRERIGLERRNGILSSKRNKSEVVKILLNVIRNISRPEFKVSDIYTKELRKIYIDKLLSELNIPTTPAKQEWSFNSEGQNNNSSDESKNSNKKDAKSKKDPRNRSTLVPKGVDLEIPGKFLRAIDVFKELRQLSAKSYPNSVAVMFRVFLELSVDAYIESFALMKDGQLTANQGTHNLLGHVNQVLNHLTAKGLINKDLQKGIKNELNDETSPLSIETLNAYVHNEHFFPKYANLITSWDNVQPFFSAVWNGISEHLKKVTE